MIIVVDEFMIAFDRKMSGRFTYARMALEKAEILNKKMAVNDIWYRYDNDIIYNTIIA